ncbi:MAG: FAD:protein FMN transferase [Planctomycetes bacterium]|nr:FAD:protein FMN transferase [Planctomycetota bacterium]
MPELPRQNRLSAPPPASPTWNTGRKNIAAILAATALLAVCSCSKPPRAENETGYWFNLTSSRVGTGVVYSAQGLVLGPIPARFCITLTGKNDKSAGEAFDSAVRAINEVNNWASVFRPDSAVSRFNRAGKDERVPVPPGFFHVMFISRETFRLSGGAFDPTVKPMIDLYREYRAMGALPSPEERRKILPAIGLQHVSVEPSGIACKDRDGVMLDLGGVAKGYAVDKAVEAFKTGGISGGLVEIGGDVRAFGSRPDGSPWRIGIVDPRAKGVLSHLASIPPTGRHTDDIALVTSGDYEQVFTVGNARHTHIFHPDTGEPVEYKGAGVSVAADNAAMADATATALFVLGREKALALAEQNDIAVLWLEARADGALDVAMSGAFKTIPLEPWASKNE